MATTGESAKSLKFPEIISKVNSPYGSPLDEMTESVFNSGYEIEITSGPDIGQVFSLDRKELTLGRMETPGEVKEGFILFQDPTVSRVHAVLRWEEELGKYVIFHISDAAPTLVNGRVIKKSLLGPDYVVTLGELNFKLICGREKRRLESAQIWEKFKTGEERGEVILDTGYKLVVVEGPDKGNSFDLDKNLMIIGRRKSKGDIRDTYGILLTVTSIPEELALLVWNKEERQFCIYQAEDSPVPLRLFRVVETVDGSQVVGRDFQNALEDKDSIMAGETVMAIHRLTEDETPEAKVAIQKEAIITKNQKDQREQKTQKETRETKEAKKTEPSKPDFEEAGARTAFGSFRVDYVFEIIDGPDTGHKISLLSDEMTEGRTITFGTSGEIRQNDIELEDSLLVNDQGYMEFADGNLYLINESSRTELMVNNYIIGENEKIVLNGGDRIKLGNTIVSFTDNRVLSTLRNYTLSMVSGSGQDLEKKFPIQKTTLFIGRGSACDVRVHDPEVSRLHAVLTFKASRFHLEHKSKVNPTFVNGVSLKKGQERIIFPGDKIYLSGKSILQLTRISEK